MKSAYAMSSSRFSTPNIVCSKGKFPMHFAASTRRRFFRRIHYSHSTHHFAVVPPRGGTRRESKFAQQDLPETPGRPASATRNAAQPWKLNGV
jgi:hypothetical protein